MTTLPSIIQTAQNHRYHHHHHRHHQQKQYQQLNRCKKPSALPLSASASAQQQQKCRHRSRLLLSLGFEETPIGFVGECREDTSSSSSNCSSTNRRMTTSLLSTTTASTTCNRLLNSDQPRRLSLNDQKMHDWNETIDRVLMRSKRYRPRRIFNYNNNIKKRSERIVQFHNDVMVKDIASHTRYSNRIKKTIWTDPATIRINAKRNSIEYEAEGWEWNSVLEDDEMYRNAHTGELIHPVWVENNNTNEYQQQQDGEEYKNEDFIIA